MPLTYETIRKGLATGNWIKKEIDQANITQGGFIHGDNDYNYALLQNETSFKIIDSEKNLILSGESQKGSRFYIFGKKVVNYYFNHLAESQKTEVIVWDLVLKKIIFKKQMLIASQIPSVIASENYLFTISAKYSEKGQIIHPIYIYNYDAQLIKEITLPASEHLLKQTSSLWARKNKLIVASNEGTIEIWNLTNLSQEFSTKIENLISPDLLDNERFVSICQTTVKKQLPNWLWARNIPTQCITVRNLKKNGNIEFQMNGRFGGLYKNIFIANKLIKNCLVVLSDISPEIPSDYQNTHYLYQGYPFELWDLDTYQKLPTPKNFTFSTADLVIKFTADGKFLVTLENLPPKKEVPNLKDGELKIWDMQTLELICTLNQQLGSFLLNHPLTQIDKGKVVCNEQLSPSVVQYNLLQCNAPEFKQQPSTTITVGHPKGEQSKQVSLITTVEPEKLPSTPPKLQIQQQQLQPIKITSSQQREDHVVQTTLLEKSWHFDAEIKPSSQSVTQKGYSLISASFKDTSKVALFYQHHPVPGMDIKSVKVIYNPTLNRSFSLRMTLLQNRKGQKAFAPTWHNENDAEWRKEINSLHQKMAQDYTDNDCPDVKLLPLWHGTKPEILDSLFRTGYANLATTDAGFFGKGIYSTHEAEYAYRVYSSGALIVNWVASFSAYPVIDGDMKKLAGGPSYKNYDAHFAPVVPASQSPYEVNYYPTKVNQQHKYVEMVVFEHAQCLPRYLVELQPSLPKAVPTTSNNWFSFFGTSDASTTTKSDNTQKEENNERCLVM